MLAAYFTLWIVGIVLMAAGCVIPAIIVTLAAAVLLSRRATHASLGLLRRPQRWVNVQRPRPADLDRRPAAVQDSTRL